MNIFSKLLHFFVFQFFLYEGEPGGGGAGAAGGGGEPPAGGGKSTLTGEPGSGGGTRAWYQIDGLAPELQGHDFVRQAPDLPTFIKNAVETKRMVGANTIKIPGKDATDAEKADFYKALGRPDDFTKYSTSEGVKLNDGLVIDAGMMDGAKQKFHELGLSEGQARGILDWYYGTLNDSEGAMKTQAESMMFQQMEQLKQEHGANLPQVIDQARAVVKQFGSPELNQWLEETKINGVPLGNSPAFIQMFSKIGAAMLDDNAGGAGSGMQAFMQDSSQAMATIKQLKTDPTFIKQLTNEMDPGHKEAVERWRALHEKAYGTEKVKAS